MPGHFKTFKNILAKLTDKKAPQHVVSQGSAQLQEALLSTVGQIQQIYPAGSMPSDC